MSTNQEKSKIDITSYSGKTVTEYFSNLFSHIFNLRDGLDRKGTIERIKSNIVMQGANVWLLICSIFVASLGLDLNSSAVIIGAMLISPLMSPILGIGLAVGIYDRKLLAKSLINYGIALFIALATSILYFLVTPFGAETPEIMARTQPHLLDVAVAFFGGIAGIVATSRKDLINAVPGVAIATALMPPVCVAGFGIANGNFNIFFGAFYLFFLNTVFVALATYLIVRLLRYPYKEYLNAKDKRRNQLFVFLFAAIVAIPSILKMFDVISDITTKNRVENYISDYFADKYDGEIQNISVGKVKSDGTRNVSVYLYGSPIPSIKEQLMDTHIKNTLCTNCNTLDLNYSSVELPDMDKFGSQIEQEYTLKLNHKTEELEQKFSDRLDSIETELANSIVVEDTIYTASLTEKLAIVVPELSLFSIGDLEQFVLPNDTSYTKRMAFVQFNTTLKTSVKAEKIKQISEFITAETGESVEVKELK